MDVASSTAKTLFKVGEFAWKVYGAEDDAHPFVKLRNAVERDLKYARPTWDRLRETRKHLIDEQDWVSGIFRDAQQALDMFNKPLALAYGGTWDKSKYVMFQSEQLIRMQTSLSVSHASLLQAIGMMHQLATQTGGHLDVKPPAPSQRAVTQPQHIFVVEAAVAPAELSASPVGPFVPGGPSTERGTSIQPFTATGQQY